MNRTIGPNAHEGLLPQLSQQSWEMGPTKETPLWEGPKAEASGSHLSRLPPLGSLLPTSADAHESSTKLARALPASPARTTSVAEMPFQLLSIPTRFLHPWRNKAGRSQSTTDEHLPFRAHRAPPSSWVHGWIRASQHGHGTSLPLPPAGSEAPGASPEICLSNATRSQFWHVLKFENHCIN